MLFYIFPKKIMEMKINITKTKHIGLTLEKSEIIITMYSNTASSTADGFNAIIQTKLLEISFVHGES